jgi:S-adenosylmethionine:tRNA ribosyltransferase-isomerase
MSQDPRFLKISDYTYDLPTERIALFPQKNRDTSKILHYLSGEIQDHVFFELPDLLPEKSLLIFNNSRVLPARLMFQNQNGASIEVFCLGPPPGVSIEQGLQKQGLVTWRCFIGNLKKWKGEVPVIKGNGWELEAHYLGAVDGTHEVAFQWSPKEMSFSEILELVGKVPLPPYIKRNATKEDEEAYQTVFAREMGAVAAPTAGLHFTSDLLRRLKNQGHKTMEVTLHVGAGTFLPVKAETMAHHQMHEEVITIKSDWLEYLIQYEGPIIPVGTTSLRLIESLYWIGAMCDTGMFDPNARPAFSQWFPYDFDENRPFKQVFQSLLDWMTVEKLKQISVPTALIIAPGYRCRVAKGIITNFHQPQSTLLLLISSLVGEDWRRIYEHALENDYRFLSFGDGSLLIP